MCSLWKQMVLTIWNSMSNSSNQFQSKYWFLFAKKKNYVCLYKLLQLMACHQSFIITVINEVTICVLLRNFTNKTDLSRCFKLLQKRCKYSYLCVRHPKLRHRIHVGKSRIDTRSIFIIIYGTIIFQTALQFTNQIRSRWVGRSSCNLTQPPENLRTWKFMA